MEWILFAAGAAVLWTVVNILDKYIISKELRDPFLVTTVFGVVMFLFFIIVSVIMSSIYVETKYIILSIAAGFIYPVAMLVYYRVMQKEEVSRYVPFLATEPLIVALAMFAFFNERLAQAQYWGIGLVVLGAILISIKRHRTKLQYHVLWLAILSVVLFAGRNLIIENVTAEINLWPYLFWFGIGGILFPLGLYLFHHPHIRKQAERGVKHLIINALISGLAIICFSKAIQLGSVSLVSGLLATKPLLVLLIATFLSFFHPKIIRERHTPQILFKKIVATILIVIGGILIIF